VPAGLIDAVAPNSLAERTGLQVGDELLSINNHPLRDVIDVRFYAAEERLALRVGRGGTALTLEAERRYGEPLGLTFARPIFDGVRHCGNACEFCFLAQMPAGLRPSLYVRDDDYRLSFLSGSYVTLTGLDESDWARIAEQHLSPLYVSVHATDGELRRQMLRNPGAPDLPAQMRRLAALAIEVHAQIVVLPGLNDGRHLARSIEDLAALYPAVRSVSVVPVGLTRYHRGGCRAHTAAEARALFDQVVTWQARLRGSLGVSFAYLSDEWYLRLGEPVPPLALYDGLDLTENGVGLVRQFLDEGWMSLMPVSRHQLSLTLVTGTLFAPVLQRKAAHLPGVEVVPVINNLLGESVTVAGLLTGQDVVAQLRSRDLRQAVVLPPAMFGGPAGQTLDEMRPEDVQEAIDRRVIVVGGETDRRGWGREDDHG
jgi:putative radical SAM enzyme (TIGR03279 family)